MNKVVAVMVMMLVMVGCATTQSKTEFPSEPRLGEVTNFVASGIMDVPGIAGAKAYQVWVGNASRQAAEIWFCNGQVKLPLPAKQATMIWIMQSPATIHLARENKIVAELQFSVCENGPTSVIFTLQGKTTVFGKYLIAK